MNEGVNEVKKRMDNDNMNALAGLPQPLWARWRVAEEGGEHHDDAGDDDSWQRDGDGGR